MLIGRGFKPREGQILYHYCSAQAGEAILRSGRLRFSDVNALNDYSEGRWGYHKFEEAATQLLKSPPPALEGINKAYFDKVDEFLAPHQLIIHPLVACLSEAADVLSQWRGYADDGTGFALGFDPSAVLGMPARVVSVSYDPKAQINEMATALAVTFLMLKAQGSFSGEVVDTVITLAADMYALKNPAFAEEREVRAIHCVNLKNEEGGIRLVSPGGTSGTTAVAGPEVHYRLSEDGLVVPYVDLPFGDVATPGLREVVLGPKNPNRVGTILLLLAALGYKNVEVRHSKATYR